MLNAFWQWLQTVKPQHAIAAFCVAIVIGRFVYPSLVYDSSSRDLILIAMLCILVPDLAKLISRVNKVKIGDKEIELAEALDDLAKKTEEAEEQLSKSEDGGFKRATPEASPNIDKYLRDPRGGLIAVAVDIEERVQTILTQNNLDTSRGYMSPMHAAELLARRGIVVRELPILMKDFWVVRNRAFHSSNVKLSEQDVYRLVDLGVRILELLAVTRSDG
ncbi:hypothetical protein NQT62_00885 [Limnobacter humi]|uniref:DUF4145 domain-containing protein n=1 Tax=Limnobacter humi TaxID=1778671 RepID=A0ABT1WBV1_9BURK|nr:hypothetical protein [Limnobacter humi]MCQ8894991.1 hypothetical protein [Limnobacter humi]